MELQDSILKAIDAITKTRIDKLQLDKTVTAEIIKCTNAFSREYKCSYNGGNITAYAAEGATYTNGQSVYVLIPQSDMTKRKTIVGVSSAKEDDENISFVSSALSDYNLIGKNVINDKKNIQPVGLHSYKKEEYFLLYDYATRNDPSRNYVNIEIEELNNNLKQAEALMIEASFQTRLPKAHKLSQDGIYGLQFVLAFADRDKTENKYEQYLPTDSVSTRYKSNQTKLQKLENKIDEIWQDAKLSLEQKTLKTKAIIKQIQNLVSGNTSIPEKDTVNDLVNGLNQIQTPEDVDKVFDKME